MDDAFDTFRNQRVRAGEATAGPFPGRYICPVCQTEVLYASGFFVSPYFRHHPGTDHEECERYSRAFYREIPLARHESEHIDAALIARRQVSRGATFITFAVRYRAHANVECVDFMSGETSTHYKIHHSLREQYFTIDRPEKHYFVRAQLIGRAQENHIIEGFGGNAAVFRMSERESVRLEAHRVLQPGVYIVVTQKPIIERFHPLVRAASMDTIAGLYVTTIDIPEDPSGEIRNNIRSLLGFETTATIARYAFLAPQLVSEVATDCWEVASADAIACYVRLSQHLSKPRRLLVQQRRRGKLSIEYLELVSDSNEFVVEANPASGDVDLYRIGIVDDRPRFLLEIRRSVDAVVPVNARLAFHFTRSNRNYRLFWSSHDLANFLKSLRKGKSKLVSIMLPKSVEISVTDATGKRARVGSDDGAVRLADLLTQSPLPIVVEPMGYPQLSLWPEGTPVTQVSPIAAPPDIIIHSRSEARLAAAFRRDRVSAYSVRALK